MICRKAIIHCPVHGKLQSKCQFIGHKSNHLVKWIFGIEKDYPGTFFLIYSFFVFSSHLTSPSSSSSFTFLFIFIVFFPHRLHYLLSTSSPSFSLLITFIFFFLIIFIVFFPRLLSSYAFVDHHLQSIIVECLHLEDKGDLPGNLAPRHLGLPDLLRNTSWDELIGVRL